MLTGKGLDWGGSQVRTEATGYGTTYFVNEMLAARRDGFDGRKVVVSGSGNVAIYAIEKVTELGGTVVACSDSQGYVVDEKGIDLDLLKTLKLTDRARIEEYANRIGHAQYVDGGSIWDVPCHVALPSATQNELDTDAAAKLVGNGLIAVGEGANMPTTPDAIRLFQDAGVAFGPGKAANAGGVATSALEMQQNASRDRWTFRHTEERLADIMQNIHQACFETAEEFGTPGDYVNGANIAGFLKVSRPMVALGVV